LAGNEKERRLTNGERFPRITADNSAGGSMTIPDDLADGWAVLLFYRGHW
jgi:peroxiredoxin